MCQAFAEMLGTAILVCLWCGVCVQEANNRLAVALSLGTTLSALVAVFGPMSGSHLNPAVSLGMFIDGHMDAKHFLCYCLAQLLGACFGASRLSGLLPRNDRLCANVLHTEPWQAVLVEALVTYLLVLVYCSAEAGRGQHNQSRPKQHTPKQHTPKPLLVGLAATAGHLFAVVAVDNCLF